MANTRPVTQLSGLLVAPLVMIGALAAILVWEIEHIGSRPLAVLLVAGTVLVGAVLSRHVHRRIEELTEYYESLLEASFEASKSAEEANRVKDEFLAVLSHELRTPLNSVLGWARMLGSGRLDEAQSAQAIGAIERAGWAQSRLIEDLLDVSQLLTGKMQIKPRPVLLESLIRHTAESLRPAARAKGIMLSVASDPDIGAITADPDRLQQVVWNLLSNATKFTPAGGRVDVRSVLDRTERSVRITVCDTGIGLRPEETVRIFERFRQVDSSSTRRYGGLGLGLGMVRHLVELHGGTVTARSEGPNRGCIFEVRLPLQAVLEPFDEGSRPDANLLDGVSVLIVDDNSFDLDLTRWSLERYGAIVTTASSAREARESYRLEPPNVIVSDLKLPDEDGIQLIQEVREIEASLGRLQTPAAALTSLGRADDRERALGAGYQLHLTKPIDPPALAAIVGQLAHKDGVME